MACRIGITMNPNRRQQEWLNRYPNMRNWVCRGPYTKSEAQAIENSEAIRLGCKAHPGGAGPEYGAWYVYYFEY